MKGRTVLKLHSATYNFHSDFLLCETSPSCQKLFENIISQYRVINLFLKGGGGGGGCKYFDMGFL